MQLRTDLALEAHRISGKGLKGVTLTQKSKGSLNISRLEISMRDAAEKLGKPCGTYITAEGMPLTDNYRDVKGQITAVADELLSLLPEKGDILVIGIGNTEITPDALGPKSAAGILATRHITGEVARSTGLDRLRSVSVLAPGVLGRTGIEVGEIVSSVAGAVSPCAVIVIDALASAGLSHLGRTIQLSDTGIVPGSGVGNDRLCLSRRTLGIPVISIGVPTVVSAAALARDIYGGCGSSGKTDRGLIVTPKEIDLLIERAAKLISMAVNCALQKNCTFEELTELVG